MASVLWVPVIFATATLLLYLMSVNLPSLSDDTGHSAIGFPSNVEELSSLASLLSQYKSEYFFYVLALFTSAYLYKQTFAIPGSVFLNLLAGALYGVWLGFPLTCFLTACGASNCYLLSKCFGKSYVLKYFPDKVSSVEAKIEENKDSLFFFLLFLRLFPMSPNWFMNLVAPILGIPLPMFFTSVLIGLMPYNFVCVQTGGLLSELHSLEEVFTLWTTLKLLAVAGVALVPGLVIRRLHHYRQTRKQKQRD